MSYTASRDQSRFLYGPALRAGTYPGQPPAQQQATPQHGAAPMAPMAPMGSPSAPTAPAAAPVMAGSLTDRQTEFANSDGNGRDNPLEGYGGGGASGFGVTSGTVGGVLGGLAGLALGIPGLGIAGSALGTYDDVRNANGMLANVGLAPSVEWAPAFGSNLSFGLGGSSASEQLEGAFARDPMAGSVMSAPAVAAGTPGAGVPDIFAQPTEFGSGWGGHNGDFNGVPDNSVAGDARDTDAGTGGDFMRGGYTGAGADGQVQPHMPAGTVHEGEVVIPAHMVAQHGLPALMALLQGEAQPSRLAALARN